MTETPGCVYCGAPCPTTDCLCKKATADRNRNSKKLSRNVTELVYWGRCPSCDAVITPMDINKYCKIECHSCGIIENLERVRNGAWR